MEAKLKENVQVVSDADRAEPVNGAVPKLGYASPPTPEQAIHDLETDERELRLLVTKLGRSNVILSMIVGVLTVCLMLCGIYLQSSANSFEQDQRAVEITLHLANSWGTQFDLDTRRRFTRVIDVLDSLKDQPAKRDSFVTCLVKEDSLMKYDEQHLPPDPNIVNLIQSDAKHDNVSFSTELSNYKAAVIRGLNAMESVAVIRRYSHSQTTRDIIDDSHWGNITLRTRQLQPFIKVYNQDMYANHHINYRAWSVLDDTKPMKN